MFGMISVAECLPNYPILNYLEHFRFVAMKGMMASFTSESLAKYEYLVTSKVLAGLLPVHIPADHEAVYTHLSAENVLAAKSQGSNPSSATKKAKFLPWFKCPKDVCLKWNQDKCERQDCERKHVCASCRGDHIHRKCAESQRKA